MEVLGIEPREQEGAIYSLKLECNNSSYLCTAQSKETSEIDLVIESNKNKSKIKYVPILNNGEDRSKVVLLWK
jgi:hypothetical protein